jgi:hypothetical protein
LFKNQSISNSRAILKKLCLVAKPRRNMANKIQKIIHLLRIRVAFPLILTLFIVSPAAYAATSPDLGAASSLTVLSGTYTNSAIGTTLNGDLGYTTGPVVAPTVNGQTYVADGTYNQAGIDQGTALGALASQACTFSFAPGAVDLATDTSHGAAGVYAPGVYCISGAATIGGGGTITLTGSGTYIFRITGALTTSANSVVTLAGASACNVWWTPGQATTLGANTTFMGTDIDPSGITIGNATTWTGRALAFGGTVSTTADTINTVPACSAASSPSTSSNGNTGGTATVSGTTSTTPGLPDTGYAVAQSTNNRLLFLAGSVIVMALGTALYLNRKKIYSARTLL